MIKNVVYLNIISITHKISQTVLFHNVFLIYAWPPLLHLFPLGSTSSLPDEEIETLKKKLKNLQERLEKEVAEKEQFEKELIAMKSNVSWKEGFIWCK